MSKRKNQLWLLIILSAATMVIPYYIQGALSSGKSPAELNETVWLFDHRAWSIRAIVEGLVIGYIARTNANSWLESTILWILKIALIGLIAFTLGPVMYAALNGLQMSQALATPMQWLWAFGLASYMPLMVLGAAYAYKVQPNDSENQIIDSQELAILTDKYNKLLAKIAKLEAKPTVKKQKMPVKNLSPTDRKEQALQLLSDGMSVPEVAEQLGVKETTVYRYRRNGK